MKAWLTQSALGRLWSQPETWSLSLKPLSGHQNKVHVRKNPHQTLGRGRGGSKTAPLGQKSSFSACFLPDWARNLVSVLVSCPDSLASIFLGFKAQYAY